MRNVCIMCGKMNTPKSLCDYYSTTTRTVCLAAYSTFALLSSVHSHGRLPTQVNSTFSNKFPFSTAAATRSLSLSCLFTCVSDACEPSETFICFARRVRMRRKTTVLLERESRLGQCCRRRRTRMMMCKTLRKGREKRSRSIRMKWRLFEANEARSDNNTIYKLVSYIDFKPLR